MIKQRVLQELENLSQEDLKDVALRVAELMQVKHGLEMAVIERNVLEQKMAEAREGLAEGKDWGTVRARLMERLRW